MIIRVIEKIKGVNNSFLNICKIRHLEQSLKCKVFLIRSNVIAFTL